MRERPLKSISESRIHLAEIVGEESLQGQTMQAGAILDLMDVAAGRAAFGHASSAVVTLSFDRVDLIYPIHHQDLIRLEAELVAVGNSSMLVSVQGFLREPATGSFKPIQHSYVTMVAVDGERRANRNIPGLRYETEDEQVLQRRAQHIKSRSAEWQRMQEAGRDGDALTVAEVEEPFNREKRERRPPGETTIEVRRVFLPRHTNILGTIFGGDILLWMDRVATYSARAFTGNARMVTIAMNRIFFREPIFTTDLVDLWARVVYVRNHTLEVEIEVSLQRLSGEVLPSHTGYFTVINLNEAGAKETIATGLELSDGDQPALRRYLQGRQRHEFWASHQKP